MRIAVIGTGYVGLVTGTCLAHVGHQVMCVDIDPDKVAQLQAGEIPIYEPGLAELFQGALHAGTIDVTTDLADGIQDAEAIFLALPTPPGADGSADLSAILKVASDLGDLLQTGGQNDFRAIINKSTVPVGTGERVHEALAANAPEGSFAVVSNPEFLREGLAVKDCLNPDRIVIGLPTDASDEQTQKSKEIMHGIYEPLIAHAETIDEADIDEVIVWMDRRSAEMTKYAANSFLAMKVSFMNEIANLSEQVGANVDSVRLGIGPDPRIGSRFLFAGIGFGGSCFPKDVLALLHTSDTAGYDFKLLRSIVEVNALQKTRLVGKLLQRHPGDKALEGKRIAIWGLAFKPDTDDTREAPALEIISQLLEHGVTITAYDPEAMKNTERHFERTAQPGRDRIRYAADALSAAQDADALLITTEWMEFRQLADDDAQLAGLKAAMRTPDIFDGRNLYDPAAMRATGFHYESIGRP